MKTLEYKDEDKDEDEDEDEFIDNDELQMMKISGDLFKETSGKINRIFLDMICYELHPDTINFEKIVDNYKELNHEKFITEVQKALNHTKSSIIKSLENRLIALNTDLIKRYSKNQNIRRKILKHCNKI